MTVARSVAPSSEAPRRVAMTEQDLLAAASRIVAEKGLGGLTLRPLAQQLETTVSAVSHRFGQKREIFAAVCEAAAEAEAERLAAWRRRFGKMRGVSAGIVADMADRVLDDMVGGGRASSLICSEFIQAAAWQDDLRTPLAHWLDQRQAFWSFLAGLGDTTLPFDLGEALHAYAIDETAYGLALNDDPAYRWLRRLGVGRLCAGLLPEPAVPDAASFAIVRGELGIEAGDIDPGVRYRVHKRSDMLMAVGRHVARLILDGGSEAVTHRSVGQRAGMPATTLVYHFPRQPDLLKAGLEAIIHDMHRQVDDNARRNGDVDFDRGADVAPATFAIALAATRHPELRPFAADMRRRRGENGCASLRRTSESPERIDMLTAQALSVAGAGSRLLRRAQGLSGVGESTQAMLALCRKPFRPFL